MEKIKTVFVAIGGVLSSLLGVLAIPVLLMVCCNIIDYITGILADIKNGGKLSSSKGLWGIVKKVCMWLLVVVGVVVDEVIKYATTTMGWTLPFTFIVACIVCLWIICNELISILENIARLGAPVPGFLKKIIGYVKTKTEASTIIEGDDSDEAETK